MLRNPIPLPRILPHGGDKQNKLKAQRVFTSIPNFAVSLNPLFIQLLRAFLKFPRYHCYEIRVRWFSSTSVRDDSSSRLSGSDFLQGACS
ncbi:hypothetical protein CEXT_784801 [Caerostris extrusa]|uniref:Uncharacterized protein n=1 Tax=Caerostris extrusa TaxID=172846 RepID=A0AAV4S0U0_CAEEX|nr:hypothetical protein CEXT_784801 [Caerostris extrusa]